MPEAIELTLADAEPVELVLDDPDEVSLVLTEEVISLEVIGEIGPRGPQGDQGIQGIQGIQGDVGPIGPANIYQHIQGAPSTVWVVQHNLGYHPAVSVEDSAGSVVFGDVLYVDQDNLTITFAAAFGGRANLS